MPTELILIIAVVAIASVVAGWLLWRRSQRVAGASSSTATADDRPDFPTQGLLVSEEVLRAAGSNSAAIWDALEVAAAPIAVEYFPVTSSELTKYRTVPVNTSVQQSLAEIVKALNPKNPTLFRVILPQGEKLAKAAGKSGLYRGWAHNGVNISSQALLKPVAAGGAIAAGWPIFAVAGTVMVMDMVAQREQRAHQRKVEAILGRQEERYYRGRITAQRTADKQLSRAIDMILDGRKPHLDLALKGADDEFHAAQQFLEDYRGVIDRLADADGKVDYRQLDEALGGKTKDVDYFIRELHLARAAMAIRRKALIADAASVALADPGNPYTALRRFFEDQARQLEEAEVIAAQLTGRISQIELKGRWHDGLKDRIYVDKSVAARQKRLRAQVALPEEAHDDAELVYVMTASGELLQVVSTDEESPIELEREE